MEREQGVPEEFRRARGHPARLQDPSRVDRPPPHSIEAEQGVLGCIILSPKECLAECERELWGPETFHDSRHRTIYEALLDLGEECGDVPVIALQQLLRDRQQLESVGGVAYLASLPDTVPSAANLGYYLSIVKEKFFLRGMNQLCLNWMGQVHECQEMEELLQVASRTEREFSRLLGMVNEKPGLNGHPRSFVQACDYNTDRDERCLLGVREDGTTSRYLCRGGAGWIIGPSGIGKSSLAIMMASLWAMGEPAFGIRAPYPLKVTVIQAENDEGDLAEMVKGVRSGLGLKDKPDLMERLADNLKVRTEASRIGREFVRWLDRVIREDRCDLLLLDPFLSFGGFDVSKQEQCSNFLRVLLNPVLHSTGAALIGMHHTGKPKTDRRVKSMRPLTAMEQAYEGLGSSELVNWARLVMNLREVGDGFFELNLSKRGNRAGATNPDGSPTRSIWLKHGEGRIWWEQVEPPAPAEEKEKEKEPRLSKAQQAAGLNSATFLAKCEKEGESLRAITKRLVSWASSKQSPRRLVLSQSTARGAIELMLGADKLECVDGLYFKGTGA